MVSLLKKFSTTFSQSFFPLGTETYNGNMSSYSHYVFTALAQQDSEVVTFEDFVVGLSVLVNGTQEEKLEWTFHLYDLDGDGVISREEMEDVVISIYELMGNSSKDLYKSFTEDGDICRKIDQAFKKLDLDGDGVVDLEEFLTVCREDEEIQKNLKYIEDVSL